MKVVTLVVLIAVSVIALGLPAFAQDQQPAPAPCRPSPLPPPRPPYPQRVDVLEKQNLVLSEDLGKAQLQNRELQEAAKAQAEAIDRLNAQLAAEQKKADEEREKQAKRNQYLWIAVGFVAAIASDTSVKWRRRLACAVKPEGRIGQPSPPCP